MKPVWKWVVSLRGDLIGGRIGPFLEGDLYGSFGLAIGPRRAVSITDMADIKIGTEIAKNSRGVTGSVVGYGAFNGDPEILIVGNRCLKENDCISGGFVGHHSGESHAGIVVDTDVQVFLSGSTISVLAAVPPGDSMPEP